MQISIAVPHDERRTRRTLAFILRPQLKFIRIMGGVLSVLGLLIVALDPTDPIGYGAVVLGLAFVFAVGPIAIARTIRMQAPALRADGHLTLDDEWVTVSLPLVESRLRWAGLARVVETPEVWYVMFGKMQAVAIPKELMSAEQRAEFAAFLARLQLAGR